MPEVNTPTTETTPGLTASEESALRETLKRCSPKTQEAAVAYRRTGDARQIPAVIVGILERFVDPEHRGRLQKAEPEMRVVEDLGVDSLTMLEVVMLVEETLKISIKNEELQALRTIGDINAFIEARISGRPAPRAAQFLPIEAIVEAMPVQAPFLFLQEARVGPLAASGRYQVAGTEFFLQGHLKGEPLVPAAILLEALGQLATLAVLRGGLSGIDGAVEARSAALSGCDGVRWSRRVRPGETLSLAVRPLRATATGAAFTGSIRVGADEVATVAEIALTFALVATAGATVPASGAGPAAAGAGTP
jgi:acyl carrier protein